MSKANGWSGRQVTEARDYWRPRLPLACRRCGRPVHSTPEKDWQVGHIVDLIHGGPATLGNTWPEHARCNMSAGGKLGAARTNARHRAARANMDSERARGIRGI